MDHHDYGGLHEDLKRTGAAMKRRDVLRLAMGGMGMGYDASARTFQRVSLTRDSVFRDGVDRQMAAMTGDAASGFTAELTVAV